MFGHLFGGGGGRPAPAPITPQTVSFILGAPDAPNLVGEKLVSTVFPQPYVGPGDLDRNNAETPEMRRGYRRIAAEEPSVSSALRGLVDAIACREVTVLPADKTRPMDRLAAEFVKWAVEETDHGWDGLADTVLLPACIDGWSCAEKSLRQTDEAPVGPKLGLPYVWTLDKVRSLDSEWVRLKTDVFWNVEAVVNLRRGLEYFSPANVILYSHNWLFSNPFGQSELRACHRAANIIHDAYKAWYVATKVYGVPYMVGKTRPERVKILQSVMQAIRGAGYAVVEDKDEIEAINLAAATGTGAFKELIATLREDVFLKVRGAYTPFLEGQGGANAHGDTAISEDQANTKELALIARYCRVVRRQLFPWLVGPNFPKCTGLPILKLGGTDLERSTKLIQVYKGVQELGGEIDPDDFYEQMGVKAAEPGKGLKPQQPPPGPGQGPPDGGPPPGPNGPPALPPAPEPKPPATMSDGPAGPADVATLAERLVALCRSPEPAPALVPPPPLPPAAIATFSDTPTPDDGDSHRAAVLALIDYLIAAKEGGADPAAGLDEFARLGADPDLLDDVALDDGSEAFASNYDESKLPRDDKGRYVGKEAIHEAKADPKKAAELRERVTDPEQRKKLDAALAGHVDLGRTKRGRPSGRAGQAPAGRTLPA